MKMSIPLFYLAAGLIDSKAKIALHPFLKYNQLQSNGGQTYCSNSEMGKK